MNINLLLKRTVILSSAIALFTQADAQEAGVVRSQGVADAKKEVDFMQIALKEAYNKPSPKVIQFVGNKKAREIPEMDASDMTNVKMDPFGAYTSANKASSGIPSPGPIENFNGLNDNGVSIPPDVNGAVGPNHIMVTLNTQVRIQDRSGNTISTVTLNSFWSPLGGISSSYDPKILYDHVANRWIFCSSAEPQTNNSCTLLAVSKTSDPTQGWNMYKVDVDATNTKWVDYPSIGFNDKWIVVQMNLFSMPNSTATSHQIYAWDKNDVYNNGAGVFTKFEITNESTAIVCPSIHYDNSTSKMYLLRVASGNSSGKGTITMRSLAGTAASASLSSPTTIQTNNTWANSGANNTNFAPQLGTTNLIATNDHRMRHVVVRNGRIWAVHSVFLPLSGASRSGVQWWELDTLGNVLQRNIIDDPTGQRFYSFPSIAVNNKNDVLLGYASFARDQYASGAYSFRKSTDAINTFRDEYVFKYGENTYFKDFGGTRNRWGDYTNTVIDPTNDSTFWTIQEYAGSTLNNWATWWAHVNPYTDIVDFEADNNYACPGESVTFSNKSSFAGSNIEWTFAGGVPASSTSANPTVTYNTSGKYRVTLVVDGKTQIKDGFVVVLTNPIRTINKNNVAPCTGNTITLTASQASSTYLWSTGATTRAIQVTQSGTYYCDITAPNGLCSKRSDSVEINFTTVNVALADFNAVNPNANPIQLTGGTPAGGTYSGPGVSNGIFTPSVAGLGIHTITYTYVSPEGCSASTTKTIEVTNAVGINTSAKIKAFAVTPNPTKGLINLSVSSATNQALVVNVIDQLGRVVWTKEYDERTQSIKKEIDLSALPKGAYFIKVDIGDASETKKLIIE